MSARTDLEVPLDAIARIGRSSHGRKNEPVLVITTVDGKEHRLVAPFEQWFAAFDHALATHRATPAWSRWNRGRGTPCATPDRTKEGACRVRRRGCLRHAPDTCRPRTSIRSRSTATGRSDLLSDALRYTRSGPPRT
jgi:hypothetical protein